MKTPIAMRRLGWTTGMASWRLWRGVGRGLG